jgi:hypothetical protein
MVDNCQEFLDNWMGYNVLRDSEIRSALRIKLEFLHIREPETAIIDELSLCQGNARVDIAVVNGTFSGYEIKSDRDTLIRLPRQLAIYELCFDLMTIVVGEKHFSECLTSVPEWWGIWEAKETEHGIIFSARRGPKHNARISPEQVVQLLWKNELREELNKQGIKPRSSAGRQQLWRSLVGCVPSEELFRIVRERVRARGDWRSGPKPFRCGGSYQSSAKSQRSQENRRWLLSVLSQHRPN